MESMYRSANIEIARLTPEILYCNWVGQQTEQSVIDSGAIILNIVKANQFTKVLNDNTRVTGSWHTAVHWAAQQWFPDMISAGLQRFAWIISPDIFAKISAQRALPEIKIVKTFSTYQEAHAWLTAD